MRENHTKTIIAQWQGSHRAEAKKALTVLALEAGRGNDAALETVLEIVTKLRLARGPIADLLFDEADIDDAEQATLIVINKNISMFHGDSLFTTWLRTVSQNEVKQLLRRKRPTDHLSPKYEDHWVERMSTYISTKADVLAAIAKLPDDFRIPLELRAELGLSYCEIAERLNQPVGTIKSRINRAKQRVLTELSGDTSTNREPK